MWTIDMHAHILPGADHGSATVENSLLQIANARSAGITAIAATSHYSIESSSIHDFLRKRSACLKALRQGAAAAGQVLPEIIPGAEVELSFDLPDLPGLEQLCYGESPYLLVELPKYLYTDWIYGKLRELESRGVIPVLAHVERYEPEITRKLLELEFPVQCNVSVLQGWKNRFMRNCLLEGGVAFLGSDVHGDGAEEYQQFGKALRKLPPELIHHMMHNAEQMLQTKRNSFPEEAPPDTPTVPDAAIPADTVEQSAQAGDSAEK